MRTRAGKQPLCPHNGAITRLSIVAPCLALNAASRRRDHQGTAVTAAPMVTAASAMSAAGETRRDSVNLLVVAGSDTPELSVLGKLPAGVNIVATGLTPEDISEQLSDDAWGRIDVVLNCGVGRSAGKRETLQKLWPRLTGLVWMHSSSAGLEHLLFPELVNSPVTLTNAKGVYSHSLAEYALTCCSYFAKDFPRLLAAKAAKNWDPYDVEELRGKTMGIVGFGDIGKATAALARAFRMRVIGLRRNTSLSADEEALVDKLHPPEQLQELMASSDYVVCATPYTPATHGLVNAAAIAAMQPHAVFVNVGRGKCVDQAALVQALRERRIRGAALDVCDPEPLPPDNELWELPNVFISPHNADRTKEFQYESIELFVDGMRRYMDGKPLLNVCDKAAGY